MSSEEDEFFDAPDAFACGSYIKRWSDNEEDLIRSASEFEHKNAQRRSRVESLKKNLIEHSASHGYIVGHAVSTSNAITNSGYRSHTGDVNVLGPDQADGRQTFPSHLPDTLLTRSRLCSDHKEDPNDRQWTFHPCQQFHTATDVTMLNPEQVVELSMNPLLSPSAPFASHFIPTDLVDLLQPDYSPSHQPLEGKSRPRTTPDSVLSISPPDRTRLSATIAAVREQNGFPNVMLDVAGSLTMEGKASPRESAAGQMIGLEPADALRPHVNASAPEVSSSSEVAQDRKNLIAYIKSWSLDAARQHPVRFPSQVLSHFKRTAQVPPLTENPDVNLFPVKQSEQPHQHYHPPTSHASRPDSPTSSNPFPTQPAPPLPPHLICTGNVCCLHKPGQLVDSMVQTADSSLSSVLDSFDSDMAPLSTQDSFKRTTVTLPAGGFDAEDRVGTIQPGQDEKTLNPIERHFRTLTQSNPSLAEGSKASTDVGAVQTLPAATTSGRMSRFQKYLRGAMSVVKSATRAKIFNQDEETSDEDEEVIGNQGIRLRSSRQARGRREFMQIKLIQEMKNEHTGAVWAMRFSPCGRLLATAGYDRNIRIWVLRQWYSYFKQMQQSAVGSSAGAEFGVDSYADGAYSNRLDEENLLDSISLASTSVSTAGKTDDGTSTCSSTQATRTDGYSPSATSNTKASASLRKQPDLERGRRTVFRSQPLLVYRGHEGVVTDLTWSKNLFLLATSMDHQVRLWHISRRECLCLFSHNDTVPTIVFHPKDDRYFLSGSLDGKLRLWNIPDKKVRFWVEVPIPSALPVANGSSTTTASNLFKSTPPPTPQVTTSSTAASGVSRNFGPKTIITCATFACEGTKVVVGTYDGRVLFFNSELTYITFIAIKFTTKGRQCRVTAVELDPTDSTKILVTSNDSRLRLIDARDYHTLCKYRGFVNETSQIRASFSPTGRYLISGSENSFFYIWRKSLEVDRISRFSRLRKDRNNCWEAIKAHDTMVTVAIFSPNPNLALDKQLRRCIALGAFGSHSEAGCVTPSLRLDQLPPNADPRHPGSYLGELVVSADCDGCIRVFKKLASEAQPTSDIHKG
ncbi:WD repeat-containing protein 44 [Clonorchis sinensis]|uniref:WD repeat-containing protein 44 n=1 Tax=Clonorchis sinensis TaxID=79923 RepID=A0A8T1MQW5_CLOSI|nr:WD repeat-containing protein 44 [Clonorchis sinensis]